MKTKRQLIDYEHKGNEKHSFRLRPTLLSLCMLTFIGGYSQTGQVNLNLKNASVKELFNAIEKQTNYRFSYRDAEVNNKGGITISTNAKELKSVLNEELNKQGLSYTLSGNKIIISLKKNNTESSKEKKVSGRIVDSKGEPVIGATIMEKGTTNGTITDFDGNFNLDVSDDAMIEVSYIGYQQQTIKAIYDKALSVTLKEDTEMLDEVVVVGYGTQNKKSLTGAVSVMNMEDTELSSVTTVSHALAGKAAGLRVNQVSAQPGGGSSFYIRGAASTGAGNEPLFVIDGFPVSSSNMLSSGNIYEAGATDNVLSSLNPDDIESITVLKDAASTAIYGARAGHGVILITTKRGKSHKAKVTYSGSASVQVARTNYKVLDAQTYMDMRNKQEYEEYLKSYGLGIYEGYVAKPENGVIPKFNPRYSNDQILNATGTNWLDEVMRTGYMHQHNVSINGGTESTKYLVSVNYMNQEGIVKNNGFDRFSARINLDQDINKFISLGLTANYSQNTYNNVPLGDGENEVSGILSSAILSNPVNPIYDENGNFFIDPLRSSAPNPVSLLGIQDKTVMDRLIGSAFVTLKPFNGMELKLQLGADRSFQKRSSYIPKTTLEGQKNNGEANISQEDRSTYLMELTAQYTKIIGNHNIKALAGYSFQKFKTAGVYSGNKDFITDSFGYNNLGYGGFAKPSVGSWASINSIASVFGRINYSYKDRYLLEATLRSDGASNFTPENRWGYFPSISAGWIISEEDFMKSTSSWLSQFKLRASYGQTGNSNVGYRINDYYAVGNGTLIGNENSVGVYAAGLGNPDLTWETTSEFNIGLDLGFINNRFRVSAEYFKRKITDLLVTNKKLLSYNEVSTIAANQGATQSQGVEVTINTVNFSTKNFDWNTTLTLSHYNDRWLERGTDWISEPYQKENDPIRAWWSYEALGILKPGEKAPKAQPDLVPGMMKLKDQNGDNLINHYDLIYMDNGDPKIIYGLNNSFRYKNFDFNIYFYGEAGRKNGESYYEDWTRMDNGTNVSTYSYKSFNSNNLDSNDPTYVRGGNGWGDYYVRPIYYIRCGNITLGYKVPINKYICDNLRIYIDVNNPFVITNWTGLDPETDNGSFPYPNITSYNVGLSLSF